MKINSYVDHENARDSIVVEFGPNQSVHVSRDEDGNIRVRAQHSAVDSEERVLGCEYEQPVFDVPIRGSVAYYGTIPVKADTPESAREIAAELCASHNFWSSSAWEGADVETDWSSADLPTVRAEP